jgi:O-antigen ligase
MSGRRWGESGPGPQRRRACGTAVWNSFTTHVRFLSRHAAYTPVHGQAAGWPVKSRTGMQTVVFAALAVVVGGASVVRPAYSVIFAACVCLLAVGSWLRHVWAIFGLVLLSAVAIIVTQASQGNLAPNWKLLGHAVLLPGALFLWRYAHRLPGPMRHAAKVGVALMGASALAGVIGGFGGLSVGLVAIWQDARWIGAIGLGFAIARSLGPLAFRWTFLWLLALNAVNLLVSLYQFREAGLPRRFGIPISPGMFGHSTQTAVVGVALLLFVLTERRLLNGRTQVAAVAIVAVEFVICARFKALIGIGAGVVLICMIRVGLRASTLALAAAMIPIVVTFGLIRLTPSTSTYDSTSTSGLATVYGHAAPRVTLFVAAERLATTNFPVGSGLATFGSYLDEQRELSTYAQIGLEGAYGFRRGEVFVSDNYVAHILAERGIVGLITWLLSLAAFVYCALLAAPRSGLFPVVTIVATIAMSPVDPTFRDGTQILLLFVPAGICLWSAIERPFRKTEETTPTMNLDNRPAMRHV